MAVNACLRRRPFTWFLSCLAIVTVGSLLSLSTSAHAQGQLLGVVHGTIKDQQGGVLPGVTVTLTPTDSRPSRITLTDATGFYTLKDLLPGDYEVKAELPGFATLVQAGVRARAGLTISLDLQMSIGAVDEVLTVRRDSPLLETSSAASGVNVSGELQRALPLSPKRDWADFLLVTPGIISQDTSGASTYSLHGAYLASHVLQIDGVEMMSAIQNSNSFIRLSTEAVDDVQVRTGAIDASSPLGVGAVVNIAAASGSNRLAWTASLAHQNRAWNASNNPGGTSTRVGLFETDLSLSGPLQRDRWWAFGAYRRTDRTVSLSRTASQIAVMHALNPSFEPFDNETNANVIFAKVTGQLSSRHQFTGFAQYDRTPSDATNAFHDGRYIQDEQGGGTYAARLSSIWGSSLTTRVAASYNDKSFERRLLVNDRPAVFVYGATVPGGGALTGSGLLAVLQNYSGGGNEEVSQKLTFTADATYVRRDWLGSHELQAGMYLQPRIHIRDSLIWANDGYIQEDAVLRNPDDPSAGVIPFHRITYDETVVPFQFIDGSDYAAYVQDAWRPTGRLTAHVGLRVDKIGKRDALFDVRTQDSLEVGPRIGVNYVLTEDGRNVLRASWTRVHDGAPLTLVAAGASTAAVRDSYDTDLNGTFETVLVTPGSTAVARDRVFDLDRWHQPYVNELTAGYRRQLPKQIMLDVGWIRREFRDRSTGVEINGIYDDGVFGGYRNEELNQIYLVANNRWNWPVYSALELQMSQQTGRLQLLGSYTRQWRHLAGTWQPNDPASFIAPEAFANNKGIGGTRGSPGSSLDANSLSGTQGVGNVAQDWRDHALRAAVSYQGPWQMFVATNYILQSGIWSGPVVTRLSAGDPRFGPASVRLSNGRLVGNPLSTPIRFAGATRSDEQFTLSSVHIWNVRVGRVFLLGSRRLQVFADAFNLTNHDADQYPLSGANQLYSTNYRRGTSRQLPRSGQVSVRFSF